MTSHPLNISLPIVEAEGLFLTGPIERIDLPGLREFESIYINSSLPLDCGPLVRQFSDTANTKSARYTCKSTAEEDAGLSMRVKVAIGVVIGVVGAGILGGLAFWWRRRRHGLSKSCHVSQVELTDLSRGGVRGQRNWERAPNDEAPPPYSPR
ncbi:predicted protein [Aspergillus nidulans FGSC A4]|uniref:Uncharacterized protein n=1 Tax=Emericella nidulans (strain FGSC A4 / ATCC 38163 / CBS 112.46 / NRRL 194 / M139) TaxID=227321 RepID=Q5ATF1_EMENI|nr:hypothetical protein [Aspergillus nidulans FGSC A4]EAA67051.1 predicted protein [Aspergillus nidulans FGSC A4]CBF80529.1 TPA: conserved hypothetical protein [Aspergillus nidulans FGSC A4]|eukprot:XP_681698.1 predicted protein [Aspergillus nidulans FGSC A4]